MYVYIFKEKRNGTLHSLHQILNWKTPVHIYTWSVYLFAIWYTYFRLHWPLYWPGGAHELSRFTFHICVWSPEQSTQPWSHPTLPSSDARPLNWWGPLSRPLVWLSLRNRRREWEFASGHLSPNEVNIDQSETVLLTAKTQMKSHVKWNI